MKSIITLLLFSLLAFSATTEIGLAERAKANELDLGSAYYHYDEDTDKYDSIFLQNFNHLTPEGGIVWGESAVSDYPGHVNFWGGNNMIGFAHENGLKVKGQHLVWARYDESAHLPNWLLDGTTENTPFDSAELSGHLKDFITKTVTHYDTTYPGTVTSWCVVNEAGSNTPGTGFVGNLWDDSLGESHIDSAFAWARAAAGSDVKLFYNEYFYHGIDHGGERIPSKIDFAYETVKGLIERGVEIDAMGFQTHISTIGYPSKDTMAADIKRFTDLGIEVYITELDVTIDTVVTPAKLERQAQIYKEVFEIALENPKVPLLCIWQFNDNQNWLGKEHEATIMDSLYVHKPAYDSIVAALPLAGEEKEDEKEPTAMTTLVKANSLAPNLTNRGIELGSSETATITITNLQGQMINSVRNFSGQLFPLEHLSQGMYIASITTKNGAWKFKIVR
jgi:endo-1,4-beta-xylanase